MKLVSRIFLALFLFSFLLAPRSDVQAAPEEQFIQFSSATYFANEGDGSVTIAVVRIGGSNGSANANFTVTDGTAINSDDYSATDGSLHWDSGGCAILPAAAGGSPLFLGGFLAVLGMFLSLRKRRS